MAGRIVSIIQSWKQLLNIQIKFILINNKVKKKKRRKKRRGTPLEYEIHLSAYINK